MQTPRKSYIFGKKRIFKKTVRLLQKNVHMLLDALKNGKNDLFYNAMKPSLDAQI